MTVSECHYFWATCKINIYQWIVLNKFCFVWQVQQEEVDLWGKEGSIDWKVECSQQFFSGRWRWWRWRVKIAVEFWMFYLNQYYVEFCGYLRRMRISYYVVDFFLFYFGLIEDDASTWTNEMDNTSFQNVLSDLVMLHVLLVVSASVGCLYGMWKRIVWLNG